MTAVIAAAADGFLHGVMHVKPGKQAVDGKDLVHQAVRSGQRETAALRSDVLAVPDKHGQAGTVEEGQAGEVGDAAGLRLLACVAEVRLQCG